MAESRRTRARRLQGGLVLCSAFLFCLLLTAWMVPRVSGAASRWLTEEPVRARTLDVDGVQLGSAPEGVEPAASGARSNTAIVDAGMRFNLLGAVACLDGAAAESGRAAVDVRTSEDGEAWSAWMTMELAEAPADDESPDAGLASAASAGAASADAASADAASAGAIRLIAEPLWVGEARYLEFRSSAPLGDLRFSFINSLGDATVSDRIGSALRSVVAAVRSIGSPGSVHAQTATPAIVTRAQWGADESWRRAAPDYAAVKMAFVHHTAGGNTYTAAQAPAVMRALYHYHVKSCGFNDIGYNFLIDRYGKIYEGRYGGVTEGVIGAQTLGFNTGSTGIAVIGEFGGTAVPAAALTSLKKLLAWKLDVHHVDPTSRVSMYCGASDKFTAGQTVSLPAISGHRDACYTACPGASLYAQLAAVRSAVSTMGLPKIYAPAASPALFSPDGDGRSDTTVISFKASERLDWRIEVRTQDGRAVRSFTGSGAAVSQVWDGRDGGGAVVADGNFIVQVSGSSSRGAARAATMTVIVDTRPVSIDDLTLGPTELARLDDGSRAPCAVRYSLSEYARTRVTIRSEDGARVRTVRDYAWEGSGVRSVQWDGTIEFAGRKIPAPDGTYKVAVEARDQAGASAVKTVAVTCRSDAAKWRRGATFCTQAMRDFSVARGGTAVFRFIAIYAPGVGESAPFAQARLVLRVRDARGTSRYTRVYANGATPLNVARAHSIPRCMLARGSYRYFIYATLPDGTRQQMAGSGSMTIR